MNFRFFSGTAGGANGNLDEQARKIAVLKQFCTMNVKVLHFSFPGLRPFFANNIGRSNWDFDLNFDKKQGTERRWKNLPHNVSFFQERTALKTILEVKVKGLVDSVARNLSELGPEHRVAREVQALQKLINASVNAMK